ncbi:MAG: metal-dependent hydrolase [Candidatus Bathyarchaeota archaeon]|nr:metal-dependent hydrolase [Candidatus Bathyarchaeota archaeon]MDH5778976.1 metal-dependent hydrolase [Candidatus Bathyarchaeota archaeon]
MNIIFHALLGLLLARLLGISSIPDVLIGVLFSIFPDFDHIPYLKKAFKTGRFGVESRSPLHELLGLVFILLGSLVVKVAYSHLFLLVISCGLSHFLVDFLTRPCRPLYPFSSKHVDLNIYPRGLKKMFILDTFLTIALGLIYAAIVLT